MTVSKRDQRQKELTEMKTGQLRDILREKGGATSYGKPKLMELILASEFDGVDVPAARPRKPDEAAA